MSTALNEDKAAKLIKCVSDEVDRQYSRFGTTCRGELDQLFVTLWKKNKFHDVAKPLAYLSVCLRRAGQKFYTRLSNRTHVELTCLDGDLISSSNVAEDLRLDFRLFHDRLPADERLVLKVLLDEASVADAANQLDMSKTAVYKRCNVLKSRMRIYFRSYQHEYR